MELVFNSIFSQIHVPTPLARRWIISLPILNYAII